MQSNIIYGREKHIWFILVCDYFYSNIHRSNTQEGVGALWTGLGPNIARNGIINAAELASYDQVKQVI